MMCWEPEVLLLNLELAHLVRTASESQDPPAPASPSLEIQVYSALHPNTGDWTQVLTLAGQVL